MMKELMPEDIILQKEYFELSPEEKELVGQWAANENQYDALRNSLMMMEESREEMEPAPSSIKDNIMASMQQESSNRFVWLNSMWAWLMPEDKPLFARPAFQISGVGALAALVTVFLWPSYEKTTSNTVAQNERVEEPSPEPIAPMEELADYSTREQEPSLKSEDSDMDMSEMEKADYALQQQGQYAEAEKNMFGAADRNSNGNMPVDELNSAGYSSDNFDLAKEQRTDAGVYKPSAPAKDYRWQADSKVSSGTLGDELARARKKESDKSVASTTVAEEPDLYSLLEVAY